MFGTRSIKKSPWRFFILVFSLSLPFWVLDVLFPVTLPVDKLHATDIGATFTPMIAAMILVYQEGEPGVCGDSLHEHSITGGLHGSGGTSPSSS